MNVDLNEFAECVDGKKYGDISIEFCAEDESARPVTIVDKSSSGGYVYLSIPQAAAIARDIIEYLGEIGG